MKKFYYYARLNDNQVCIEIVSRVTKLVDVVGYVEIPEYNETYRYRKYDPVTEWSAETYEPDVDTVIQDKLAVLEDANLTLVQSNMDLSVRLQFAEMALLGMMDKVGGEA